MLHPEWKGFGNLMPVESDRQWFEGPGFFKIYKSVVPQGQNGGHIIAVPFIFRVVDHSYGAMPDLVFGKNFVPEKVVHQQQLVLRARHVQ